MIAKWQIMGYHGPLWASMEHYDFSWVNKTFPRRRNQGLFDIPERLKGRPFRPQAIRHPDFGGFMAGKCWFLGIFGPSRKGSGEGVAGKPKKPEKKKSQTACKPGSVPACAGDGHSSGTPVTGRLARPTRAAARKPACRNKSGVPPLLGLAPGGVYPATPVAGGAVRSYRTLSPLPRAGAR